MLGLQVHTVHQLCTWVMKIETQALISSSQHLANGAISRTKHFFYCFDKTQEDMSELEQRHLWGWVRNPSALLPQHTKLQLPFSWSQTDTAATTVWMLHAGSLQASQTATQPSPLERSLGACICCSPCRQQGRRRQL